MLRAGEAHGSWRNAVAVFGSPAPLGIFPQTQSAPLGADPQFPITCTLTASHIFMATFHVTLFRAGGIFW